ncbi:xanthine dehydrogenase family protein molybdopterin-binding subunit [Granulicella tundricola]|uniref:Aldehyde oxidase and xanthine dehydrogenase molybdopterin binding protein n=1 Tax=Granulicella tundricola (strain ATCC BAA-1859 / DSM 23138 / MP5ACTX9) TaxID=1198114 RepID=E8WX08_GRATM|nr:xanthine dehydrogenase family protein molybdopterin-binding subunit [Granulicella tundricola]ADW68569.1 aldehyde oxidase and xanthine dehydrogenase molybdopterin binding protein [Granulicella tundricola MP5ACTX9]
MSILEAAQEETAKKPIKQLDHRYDGIAKVTGKATYAGDFKEPFAKDDLLYAWMVQSTIANGTIASMDSSAAEHAPGVVAVMTPFNSPKIPQPPAQPPARRNLTILQNTDVKYNGQPIAVVVAKTLVQARQAATLLKIKYTEQPAKVIYQDHLADARWPGNPGKEPAGNTRGDIAAGFAKATVTVEGTYTTPIQVHNPMEPHATIAWWEGEKLNLYDATQYITGVKMSIAKTLNIPLDFVRVQCPYTGGGFGSKGSSWSHIPLCAMAAKLTGKPVKLVLDRSQMFGPVGARPSTVNKIKLGATADGKLVAMQQNVIMNAAALEDFTEHSAGPTKMLYMSENNQVSEKLVTVNLGVSTFMRAPGEAPGTAVLEIAMDELAEKLKMDPVQLRVINHADKDPSHDRPWTSKNLKQCYTQAAERFGWSKRSATPAQMTEGNNLIGYGMATATYPANRSAAMAIARILPNGRAFIGSGTQDLGTGMYTIMAQTAAAMLGLDPTLMDVKLGDSTLPKAPVSGGSQSTASVMPAVQEAAMQAKLKLFDMAVNDTASPVHGMKTSDLEAKGGKYFAKADPTKGETFVAIIARNGGKPIEATGSAEPSESKDSMTSQSFGAVFAEVAVDKDTHMVKVRRVVATYDIGTLLNDKTGLNQLMGGIVWGVSFATHEDAHIDPNTGRTVNESFAEYHVPVNADIGTIDATVLNIPDLKFNPLGARGIGEIGITGAAAAVANAIYNATGKRIREYPITPDKLMA